MVANPPIDYSFKELKCCAELETEDPQRGSVRRKADREAQAAREAEAANASGLGASGEQTLAIAKPSKGKLVKKVVRQVTVAVKLNNNFLETVQDLPMSLDFVMEDPLRNCWWIDLSFNQLRTIEPALLEFQQLKALYMHGNQIKSLPAVERLRKLPKLISLTLNGNPIERCRAYRTYVIGALPNIRSLDHSMVTGEETAQASNWFQNHLKRAEKRAKEKEEQSFAD